MTAQADQPVLRPTFVNLATGEQCIAPQNPTEDEWKMSTEFDRTKIPGGGHQPIQFISSGNTTFEFEIVTLVQTALQRQEVDIFRRFIMSLAVPRAGGADEVSGGLPRVLIVWPNVCSLTCFLDSPGEKVTRRNRFNHAVESTFTIKLEEVRDVRLTSEDVRRTGLMRGSLPGGSQ